MCHFFLNGRTASSKRSLSNSAKSKTFSLKSTFSAHIGKSRPRFLVKTGVPSYTKLSPFTAQSFMIRSLTRSYHHTTLLTMCQMTNLPKREKSIWINGPKMSRRRVDTLTALMQRNRINCGYDPPTGFIDGLLYRKFSRGNGTSRRLFDR